MPAAQSRRWHGARESGEPRHGIVPTPLAQQHSTLAQSAEAITFVRDFLLRGTLTERPRLGVGDIGLALPDMVRPGVEWTATLTGTEPRDARVTVTDLETEREIEAVVHRRTDTVQAAVTLPQPGLYRLLVTGGATPVSQLVLAESTS